jgi:hypothetical protein
MKKIGYYNNILAYLAYFWHQSFKKIPKFPQFNCFAKTFFEQTRVISQKYGLADGEVRGGDGHPQWEQCGKGVID